MTHLKCEICDRTVDRCACPDIDARLHQTAYDPAATNVMLKWCRLCDKHFARCACAAPQFFLISAGETITQRRFRAADGSIVEPDLSAR